MGKKWPSDGLYAQVVLNWVSDPVDDGVSFRCFRASLFAVELVQVSKDTYDLKLVGNVAHVHASRYVDQSVNLSGSSGTTPEAHL